MIGNMIISRGEARSSQNPPSVGSPCDVIESCIQKEEGFRLQIFYSTVSKTDQQTKFYAFK